MSIEERHFIEANLALAAGLRRRREHLGLTQTQVAQRFGSSQSRVAKMEAADRTVSQLAGKRPSPFERGDPRIWAAASIYAVGSVNFLFDRPRIRHRGPRKR